MLISRTATPFSTTFALIITATLSAQAIADDQTSGIISDAINPGDSNSRWVLGGSVGAYNNPLAGEGSEYYLSPDVEYRGERFFLKGAEAGVSLYQQPEYSVGLVLTGNGSLLADKDDYKGNVRLAGLKERDDTLDAGFYFIHRSDAGRLKLTVLDEVTGEHHGQSADVNFIFDYKLHSWNINPVVGATWMSEDMVNHFYGVSATEANSHRSAYQGDSAINLYAGIRGRYDITDHWDVTASATYVRLGSGIADSSIVEDDGILVSSLGVNYNF